MISRCKNTNCMHFSLTSLSGSAFPKVSQQEFLAFDLRYHPTKELTAKSMLAIQCATSFGRPGDKINGPSMSMCKLCSLWSDVAMEIEALEWVSSI